MAKKEKQGRGELTKRIKEKSKELLGYEIDQTELRLMVYIQYVMCNGQKIDPAVCSSDDRGILSKWREAKHIEGGASGLKITEEFWNVLCKIIFLGYVDLTN